MSGLTHNECVYIDRVTRAQIHAITDHSNCQHSAINHHDDTIPNAPRPPSSLTTEFEPATRAQVPQTHGRDEPSRHHTRPLKQKYGAVVFSVHKHQTTNLHIQPSTASPLVQELRTGIAPGPQADPPRNAQWQVIRQTLRLSPLNTGSIQLAMSELARRMWSSRRSRSLESVWRATGICARAMSVHTSSHPDGIGR